MPTTNSPKGSAIPVRPTPQMRQQLDELVAAGFGNQTDVIRTAVHDMYQREKWRQTMNNKEIAAQIEANYQAAVSSGVLGSIADVARELGHDPASYDEQGNRTGYVSTYGPKRVWLSGDVRVYVDDYGHYMTVHAGGREVCSTHPCSEFFIAGPWVEEIFNHLPAAKEKQERRQQERESAERERLLAKLA